MEKFATDVTYLRGNACKNSTVLHIPSSPAFAIVENDAEMFVDVHDVLRHLLWKSFACGKNCVMLLSM